MGCCCCCCCVASVLSYSVRPHRRKPTRLPRPWDSPGKNTGGGCHFLLQCMKAESESEVAQSCLTLSDPMDCSLPGSSIHGIFQARVLEWGAIAFSNLLLSNGNINTVTGSKLTIQPGNESETGVEARNRTSFRKPNKEPSRQSGCRVLLRIRDGGR